MNLTFEVFGFIESTRIFHLSSFDKDFGNLNNAESTVSLLAVISFNQNRNIKNSSTLSLE